MTENINIDIDNGVKTFTVNGDESRVIRFNPADIGIIERINDAYETVSSIEKTIDTASGEKNDMKSIAAAMKKANDIICEQIDYIFGYPVSEAVFGGVSPLSPVKGKTLFEAFLDAVLPIITDALETEFAASEKRTQKYIKQVKQEK